MYITKNHQRDTLTQCFYEGAHPSSATSPWSNFHDLGAFVLAQCGKNVGYKALWLLIHAPMCSNDPGGYWW